MYFKKQASVKHARNVWINRVVQNQIVKIESQKRGPAQLQILDQCDKSGIFYFQIFDFSLHAKLPFFQLI
jgi:hypothetical protein